MVRHRTQAYLREQHRLRLDWTRRATSNPGLIWLPSTLFLPIRPAPPLRLAVTAAAADASTNQPPLTSRTGRLLEHASDRLGAPTPAPDRQHPPFGARQAPLPSRLLKHLPRQRALFAWTFCHIKSAGALDPRIQNNESQHRVLPEQHRALVLCAFPPFHSTKLIDRPPVRSAFFSLTPQGAIRSLPNSATASRLHRPPPALEGAQLFDPNFNHLTVGLGPVLAIGRCPLLTDSHHGRDAFRDIFFGFRFPGFCIAGF